MKKQLFDLDDILLQCEVLSDIDSRSQIDVLNNGYLPLFAAPMFDVVSQDNISNYKDNKIIPIIPRTLFDFSKITEISKETWCAVSLEEFEIFYNSFIFLPNKCHILIDIANGHMKRMYDLAEKSKLKFGDNLVLMVGNIANPLTYQKLSDIGVDYVRCSIGSGSACLTSVQTAIGYPMGSLISECRKLKIDNSLTCKIIVDGGMKSFSDIIKSLAIGADFVMVGSLFNKALESSGDTIDSINEIVNQYDPLIYSNFKNGEKYYKTYRGMSTKNIQKTIKDSTKLKTSEGIVITHKVEYTLSQWVENFTDYLKSTMSYTGSKNLDEFIGEVQYNLITQNALQRYKK